MVHWHWEGGGAYQRGTMWSLALSNHTEPDLTKQEVRPWPSDFLFLCEHSLSLWQPDGLTVRSGQPGYSGRGTSPTSPPILSFPVVMMTRRPATYWGHGLQLASEGVAMATMPTQNYISFKKKPKPAPPAATSCLHSLPVASFPVDLLFPSSITSSLPVCLCHFLSTRSPPACEGMHFGRVDQMPWVGNSHNNNNNNNHHRHHHDNDEERLRYPHKKKHANANASS